METMQRPSTDINAIATFNSNAVDTIQIDSIDSIEKNDLVDTFKNSGTHSQIIKKNIRSEQRQLPLKKDVIVKKNDEKVYEGLKERSEKYYQKALLFLDVNNDSALFYANEANKNYENGSIFRVKAEALYNRGDYSSSNIACDVCISRNDHWDASDLYKCSSIKCAALKKIYEKWPSEESRKAYENCSHTGINVSR